MIFGIGQPDLAAGDAYYAKAPDVARIAQEVKALGANSIRFSAVWMFIDPYNSKKYKWANLDRAVTACRDAGLDILLTVEPRTRSNAADFGLLCAAIAARYAGEIAWFEIGNEVNGFGNSVSPHDPAKFVEFQKQAYDNIMPYAPSSLVFAAALMAIGTGWASLSPIEWTQGFIDSNGPDYCHALSMHPYMRNGHDYTPQLPAADNWSFKNIEALRAMLDNAGATSTLIACTEWGYDSMTSPSGLSVTPTELEAEQAANVTTQWNLLKAYADAGTIYDVTWPFMYRDWEQVDRKAGYHYGMVHNDYTRKAEWSFFRNLDAPWSGVITDAVGVNDTAMFNLQSPAFPRSDLVGITDSATFVIPSGDVEYVSTGAGNRSTAVNIDTTITWTHVVTDETAAALMAGLVVSTDHLKDWSLYNTLTVTSSLDGVLTRAGSRHISASSIKKGSVHGFELANTDGTPIRPTVGTHTMTAHVKLNNDFTTSITSVAANSVLYKNVETFGGAVFSNGSNTGGGTPSVTASSAAGNKVFFVFGGSNDFSPTFNKTTRYSAGSTVDGDGDYSLIGDAAGANTVTGATTQIGVKYGTLAFDLVHGAGSGGGGGTPPPPPPPTPPPPSAFVIRDNTTGNLMLGGSRFRFSGGNCANDIGKVGSGNGNAYGGTVVSGSYLTTNSQIDALLNSASQMHAGVLKATWSVHTTNHALAVQPTLGVFNNASLEPIDYALQQCALRGIRLVIPFCEEYTAKPWYVSATGGGGNDNFYTRTATVDAYKAHISYVLNHVNRYTGVALKDDPTVLCWQIGNEFTSPSLTDLQYQTWADDIGHHIKIVERAQQLIQDGSYGPKGLNAVYVDIYDQHSYDKYRTTSFIESQGAACHAAGKAYFIGEFDWTDNSSHSSYWTLDDYVDHFERSNTIDGATFWDLLAPLTNWGDGYTLHYPGTSANMQTRGDMLSDHAQRMAGIAPKTFLSDSFTGTNGALLSSHVGEIGATWDQQATAWTGVPTIQNNRIWANSEAHYYSSGVPASADYTVSADVYVVSLLGVAGVAARSTTEDTHSYVGYVTYSGGTTTCSIIRHGGAVNLGSATVSTPTVGSTHTIKLKVQGSALSLYWDNVPVVGPITDATHAAAGRAGVRLGGSATATTGFHLDNITATDL